MARVGFAGVAHMHAYGYAHGLAGQVAGVWDEAEERSRAFADKVGCPQFGSITDLIENSDGAIVCSENTRHLPIIELLAPSRIPILCEKPIVTTEDDAQRMLQLIAETGVKVMTAFPCRYSPAFKSLKSKVDDGEIGEIRAIMATNRGRCPHDWFTQTDLSGGGAMIDHVVHVTDLLRVLLNDEPGRVTAQTGNNMYGQDWEDTAMLTIEFPGGVFATLDSSWSRHASYKTWGDVTMTVVGEDGVLEVDLFAQEMEVFGSNGHSVSAYGSDIDAGLVADFLRVVNGECEPPVTAYDGIQAVRVALSGYASERRREAVVPTGALESLTLL